jgi:predicted nucleic acid-binding protein
MAEAIPGAVIDANILYQRYPRNLLVWLAIERAFTMFVSPDILAEVRRHLIERNIDEHGEPREDAVERTIALIREALEDAHAGEEVPAAEVAAQLPIAQMGHNVKDEHVLAAAAAAGAEYLVTHDLDGFPAQACAPHGVTPIGLDEFLMVVVGRSVPDAIVTALHRLALYPPNELGALMDIVGDYAPRFAAAARELLRERGEASHD